MFADLCLLILSPDLLLLTSIPDFVAELYELCSLILSLFSSWFGSRLIYVISTLLNTLDLNYSCFEDRSSLALVTHKTYPLTVLILIPGVSKNYAECSTEFHYFRYLNH